jgi:RimJ/RimL family protein N-acetyltransferase
VDKLMATCDALNTASERVMKKLAMEQEQRLYRDKFIKGLYRDTLVYAVDRDTWIRKNSPPL